MTRWNWWTFNVGDAGVRRLANAEGVGVFLRLMLARAWLFKRRGRGEFTHKLDFGAWSWVGFHAGRVWKDAWPIEHAPLCPFSVVTMLPFFILLLLFLVALIHL